MSICILCYRRFAILVHTFQNCILLSCHKKWGALNKIKQLNSSFSPYSKGENSVPLHSFPPYIKGKNSVPLHSFSPYIKGENSLPLHSFSPYNKGKNSVPLAFSHGVRKTGAWERGYNVTQLVHLRISIEIPL